MMAASQPVIESIINVRLKLFNVVDQLSISVIRYRLIASEIEKGE